MLKHYKGFALENGSPAAIKAAGHVTPSVSALIHLLLSVDEAEGKDDDDDVA